MSRRGGLTRSGRLTHATGGKKIRETQEATTHTFATHLSSFFAPRPNTHSPHQRPPSSTPTPLFHYFIGQSRPSSRPVSFGSQHFRTVHPVPRSPFHSHHACGLPCRPPAGGRRPGRSCRQRHSHAVPSLHPGQSQQPGVAQRGGEFWRREKKNGGRHLALWPPGILPCGHPGGGWRPHPPLIHIEGVDGASRGTGEAEGVEGGGRRRRAIRTRGDGASGAVWHVSRPRRARWMPHAKGVVRLYAAIERATRGGGGLAGNKTGWGGRRRQNALALVGPPYAPAGSRPLPPFLPLSSSFHSLHPTHLPSPSPPFLSSSVLRHL